MTDYQNVYAGYDVIETRLFECKEDRDKEAEQKQKMLMGCQSRRDWNDDDDDMNGYSIHPFEIDQIIAHRER